MMAEQADQANNGPDMPDGGVPEEGANANQGNPGQINIGNTLNLKAPKALNCTTETIVHVWREWQEEMELYMDLAHSDKTEPYKVKMLKYLLGTTGRQIYDTLQFDKVEQHRTLKDVFTAFQKLCDPRRNETVERYRFFTRKQHDCEGIDSYVTELKVLARTCNFGDLESSLIRDIIILGIRDDGLRARLLRQSDLNLQNCIQICRSTELSKDRVKTLKAEKPEQVLAMQTRKSYKQNKSFSHARKNTGSRPTDTSNQGSNKNNNRQTVTSCAYCGESHKRGQCPAYGKECNFCKKLNHYSKVCFSRGKDVHQLSSSEGSSDEYEEVNIIEETVNHIQTQHPKAKMTIGSSKEQQTTLDFQIDTGATCNVISEKAIHNVRHSLIETKKYIRGYSQGIVKPLGQTSLKITNPKNNKKYKLEFLVVHDPNSAPILGRHAVEQMDLVKLQYENIMTLNDNRECSAEKPMEMADLEREFGEVFEGTGCLSTQTQMVSL